MDEAAARRIVLAQAIETTDSRGELVDDGERSRSQKQAIEAAEAAGEAGTPAAVAAYLKTRAGLLLQAAAARDRAIASLQEANPGERWIALGIPLAALVLGIFTDQVANPRQVNLLSKPLLLLLLWNLVVYAVLVAGVLMSRQRPDRPPRLAGLRQWLAGLREWSRRPGHLRSEVTAAFLLRWHGLTAGLYGQRLSRVLHLAAAAWGLGVALSLFFGGVWASYGVQWESTFLSATDVHRFLRVLFSPVTALFPWASFSLEEIRSLRAAGPMPAPPDAADNFTGRRWVFLYAMLLALVVVLPRLLLAFAAWLRERKLAQSVSLDLGEDYFQRLVTSMSPARVLLCVYAHRGEDRAALLRVLLHRVDTSLPGMSLGQGQSHELLTGSAGEVLRVIDLPNTDPAALLQDGGTQPGGWADRLRESMFGKTPQPQVPREKSWAQARDDGDVVLHVVSNGMDVDGAAPLLQWLDKPVIVLVNADTERHPGDDLLAKCRARAAAGGPPWSVLGFDAFARSWVQERVLLDAIGRSLPGYKAEGFGRLAAAWDARNTEYLRESMAILARHLLQAARQTGDVGTAPRSLISLVSPGERDAHDRRSREAMASVVERLQQSDQQATSGLLVLHGIDAGSAAVLNHRLEEKFVVQDAISARQAGMAGAATGAAMGVSIDLLTAGLTLGLAAAAGAVVGGGAAWVAAVWKNKATPAGTSVVQLSDEMMQAMVEAALLRYLAVIHFGRGDSEAIGAELRPEWRSEVVAAVERRSDDLREQWAMARSQQDSLDPVAGLVGMLESIALGVLNRLYPAARP